MQLEMFLKSTRFYLRIRIKKHIHRLFIILLYIFESNNAKIMKVAIITGAGGLVGVESVKYFSKKFDKVIGIDNDSRGYFFGESGSITQNIKALKDTFSNFIHYPVDIRDSTRINEIFKKYGSQIDLVINCAAQPSHDWSGKNPLEDFEINAFGAVKILEATRIHSLESVFIQLSSSKVYGDRLNSFEYDELPQRFDLPEENKYYKGFDESLDLDQSLHSPYGAGKLSADVMCQEYARYYGMKVGIFRPNCITGGPHSGVELHGFLSYLVKCKVKYNVFGYQGKQVRDNIHGHDLVMAFDQYYDNPSPGECYNIGGGRNNSCSIIEAIKLVQELTSKSIDYRIEDNARIGDHIWWITNNDKFKSQYPNWNITYSLEDLILEIFEGTK
jgi:CDP-paratose 2-epimerase